jgi:hypothetical protein
MLLIHVIPRAALLDRNQPISIIPEKGGIEMIEGEMDQKWQEFQDRIENIFGPLLRGDIQRIEYKPQFAVPLLEMPSGYREIKSSGMNDAMNFTKP